MYFVYIKFCLEEKIAHFYLTLIFKYLVMAFPKTLCMHFAWSNIYLYSLFTHVQLLCTATWRQAGLRFVIQSQQSFKLAWL